MSATRDLLDGGAAPAASFLRRMLIHLGAWLALLVRAPARTHDGGRMFPRWPHWTTAGLVAAATLAGTMVFVDAWAADRQHDLPFWLVQIFGRITDFGKSGWFLWPIAILVIVAAALARPALGRVTNLVILSLVVRLEFIFFAIGIPALTVSIVKRLIGRARPSHWGPFHYVPFAWRPDLASMPSGHSTAAFAAAFAIGAIWPGARVPMWIYAGVIALSRVIVHAHFPSDVIAGAFVGLFSAVLVREWFVARRLVFIRGGDGNVRALPGPSAGRIKRLAAKLAAQ